MFENLNWCQTPLKNIIPLYSSLKPKDLKQPILFIGGVHGDEPEGVQLAQNLLDYLKITSVKNDWALITCLNPDGYKKNHRVNANGVDLNRNFPSSDWVSAHTKERYFPGTHPNSEPETQALVKLINSIKPAFIFHFHSWKPSIIITGPIDHPIALTFSQVSNYPLYNDIGYPTPGSLGQYAWNNLNIPVICVEEAEKESSQSSWLRFKPAFQRLLNFNFFV